MLISKETEHLGRRLGVEKAVRMICEAGFEAIDLSLFDLVNDSFEFAGSDYLKKAKEIRNIVESYGIRFNQAHAPFPSYIVGNKEYNEKIYPLLLRSIEIAGAIGADQVIVHPVYVENSKKQFNMDLYRSFEPYCRDFGVKVALENMFHWESGVGIIPNVCSIAEEFRDYMDSLDSRYFTACLDIGHCGLVGESPAHMIETLGHDHLTALHIHDNDGIHDMHTMPFTQKIDFKSVAESLRKIDYSGDLTLEADMFLSHFPDSMLPAALKLMRDADTEIREMIRG